VRAWRDLNPLSSFHTQVVVTSDAHYHKCWDFCPSPWAISLSKPSLLAVFARAVLPCRPESSQIRSPVLQWVSQMVCTRTTVLDSAAKHAHGDAGASSKRRVCCVHMCVQGVHALASQCTQFWRGVMSFTLDEGRMSMSLTHWQHVRTHCSSPLHIFHLPFAREHLAANPPSPAVQHTPRTASPSG